ncbi:MAG: hypothetical protein IKG65_01385 [Exiguobacterium sp.]|nr:hypothetical protein [Exiguobacterium sp.]MBR3215456.1 hypothetical protein [Exiguobacterium sp.]
MLRSSVTVTIMVSLLPLPALVFLGIESTGTDWGSLLIDETWRDSFITTLYVVNVSTGLSLVIGTWLARTVVQKGWRFLSSVLRLPMFVPHMPPHTCFGYSSAERTASYGLRRTNETMSRSS